MLKKIVLGTILVGLSSVLVIGAINRSKTISERSETTSARSQGEGGWGQNSSGNEVASGNQRGNGGNFQESDEATNSLNNGNGQNGQGGQGNGGGNQTALLEAEVEEWLPLEGTVQSVTDEGLTLNLSDDEQILVEGRAWKYALESGFTTEVDNQILITGFYEDGEFKFGSLEDLSTGLEVTLRDTSGRPMWSGGWGRGGA
jgi:hypothetical protein